MSDRVRRTKNRIQEGVVERTEHLSPRMIRLVVGGVSGFESRPHTDQYIKVLFPAPGTDLSQDVDIAAVRERLPREQWPQSRTYTVRKWDPEASELWVDFVSHGDEGIAGPWARRARPGDVFRFVGPGGAYAPDPSADWHLLVGDESALPAIAGALEALPTDAKAVVYIELSDLECKQPLNTPAQAEIVWVKQLDQHGDGLVQAVVEMDFPPGRPHVFVHGEADTVRRIRRHLRLDRKLPREGASVSGYWRMGEDENGWQATKAEWNRQADLAELGVDPSVTSPYLR